MRAAKAVFLVGIILLVLSVIIAAIGASGETWEQKKQPLVETILTTPGGWRDFPLPNLVYLPENSRDVMVSGTVKELRGRMFDFYAFNKRNYELWFANASYKAYVEVKGVSSYSLDFSPTREDIMNVLYFVVVNTEPYFGPDISVDFSIRISWSERSYAPVLGGFVAGTFLGGLGVLLVVVSAIVKFVFGRERGEQVQAPSPTQAVGPRFCTNCGAALQGDIRFCGRCGSPAS